MIADSLCRKNILIVLFVIFAGFNSGKAEGISHPKMGQVSVSVEKGERVYVIQAPVTDLNEFREIAKQAARLKPFGKVEINISELADKGFYEIPEGRNSWYEYASYNPTPYKFFPDPKIAPFIPADFVKKNRELLLAKAKILREYGLGAAFWSYEPNFLPEAFFEKYPHMRGARVDHPRRGDYPAFAPCISVKETQEMFTGMVTELLKNVPEIHTFFFKTNDAGSGICWSDWQYVGPNGPAHCKNHSMGERIETLMNTFKKGASDADRKISIYLTGCYSFAPNGEEKSMLILCILHLLPSKKPINTEVKPWVVPPEYTGELPTGISQGHWLLHLTGYQQKKNLTLCHMFSIHQR